MGVGKLARPTRFELVTAAFGDRLPSSERDACCRFSSYHDDAEPIHTNLTQPVVAVGSKTARLLKNGALGKALCFCLPMSLTVTRLLEVSRSPSSQTGAIAICGGNADPVFA